MDSFANITPTSSSGSSVELGDYLICSHGKEQCDVCQIDHREDNSFTAGIDAIATRAPICVDILFDKDGVIQCKKHKAKNCGPCHGLKKQVIKSTKDAQKANSKIKPSTSNFY